MLGMERVKSQGWRHRLGNMCLEDDWTPTSETSGKRGRGGMSCGQNAHRWQWCPDSLVLFSENVTLGIKGGLWFMQHCGPCLDSTGEGGMFASVDQPQFGCQNWVSNRFCPPTL